MPKRWRIASHDAAQVESLMRATGLPALVAQILVSRGIVDSQAATDFLEPKLTGLRDPFQLPGVTDATEFIGAAIRDGRRIIVYGDYDADGITGSSILIHCLRLLGANVGYYVPNRLDEGYGLNDKALASLSADGAELVITVDCGIANVAEIDRAAQNGLQIVVTDHHLMADRLPAAEAIVHPMLPGFDYPFHGLCGAGVAFKLAWALCQHVSQEKRVSPQLREFLLQAVGLAAIGTVADIVPLEDENRIIVHHGLRSLLARPGLGLRLLLERTGLTEKSELSSEDIGFTIAPRLNAAGRLGQAALGVELLTTDNAERAASLASYIDELNKTRDRLERSVYLLANRQASEAVDDGLPSLVLGGAGWHKGVIGIVAGRLAEKYQRPTLLVSFDESGVRPGVGSARTAGGLDLVAALAECRDHLITYGGHAAAAGFKVEEKNLATLRAAFCEQVAQHCAGAEATVELRIDGEVPFSGLTHASVGELERLAPFGKANRRPLFCTSGVQLAAPPRTMGSGDRHLALQLQQHGVRLRAVAFGRGEWCEELTNSPGPFSFAFRPAINTFRGQRRVEIQLEDWQPAEVTENALAGPA